MAEYTGDRPRFGLLNQRLDKPDLEAVSSLVNKTFVRMFGNLMGPSWGCLTKPTFDTTDYGTTGRVTIVGPAVFAYSWSSANGIGELEGGVVIYDENRTAQATTTVSISSGWVGLDVWLWFKREDAEDGYDARRYWPATSEEVSATYTKTSERVTFRATKGDGTGGEPETDEDHGWFRFARIDGSTGWSGGEPDPDEIKPISFFDGWYTQALSVAAIDALNTWGPYSIAPTIPSAGNRYGVVQYLQAIINKIAQLIDTDFVYDPTNALQGVADENDVHWQLTPSRGVRQLNTAVTAIEAQILPVYTGTINWNGSAFTLSGTTQAGLCSSTAISTSAFTAGTIYTTGGNKATLTFNNVSSDWVITGISVTPDNGVGFTANTMPVYVSTACSVSLPHTGAGIPMGFELVRYRMVNTADANNLVVVDGTMHVTVYGKRS